MSTVFIILILSLAGSTFVQQSVLFRDRVMMRRWIAAFILGMPALVMSWEELDSVGLIPHEPVPTILISLSFGLLVILFTSVFAVKPENLTRYPELCVSTWTTSLFLKSSAAWLVYDVAYEFLFRGYLFMTLAERWGNFVAMVITVALYAGAHITKGSREMWLCIPFGILLCSVTQLTENIWSAVVIHGALSVSNEYFAACAKYGYQLTWSWSSFVDRSKTIQRQS